jgi:hypothetical protein
MCDDDTVTFGVPFHAIDRDFGDLLEPFVDSFY